jgi:hypothetical protein
MTYEAESSWGAPEVHPTVTADHLDSQKCRVKTARRQDVHRAA